MSRRYEVANRYSSYLESRRQYLERESEESEEDIEVKTILRRPFQNSYRTVSTSASNSEKEDIDSKMVLVPPVTVQQETKEEIEIPPLEPLKSEKEIEENPSSSEPIDQESIKEKVENIIRIASEKCKETIEVARSKIEDLTKDISKEFGSIWSVVWYVTITVLSVFTLVALYRCIFRETSEAKGWFCTYFATPFAPLFNAFCEEENINLIHRLPMEMWIMSDEIGVAIAHAFHNIANGFSVFGTLFNAVSSGITDNLSFGVHELGENVGENISHLLHFVVQLVHIVFHFLFSIIASIAGGIAGGATVIHDYFEPPQVFYW